MKRVLFHLLAMVAAVAFLGACASDKPAVREITPDSGDSGGGGVTGWFTNLFK